jgi:hypothetical protein
VPVLDGFPGFWHVAEEPQHFFSSLLLQKTRASFIRPGRSRQAGSGSGAPGVQPALRFALGQSHGRPRHGLCYRRSIDRVGLVRLHIGLHKSRRKGPGDLPYSDQFPSQPLRSGASFHADQRFGAKSTKDRNVSRANLARWIVQRPAGRSSRWRHRSRMSLPAQPGLIKTLQPSTRKTAVIYCTSTRWRLAKATYRPGSCRRAF